MAKEILSHIDGVGIYGVISICIFFGFFSGMLLWAFTKKKDYLDTMAGLPLNAGEKNPTDKL
jgi:cytochrome c oxidase cbb3-type subunit IV